MSRRWLAGSVLLGLLGLIVLALLAIWQGRAYVDYSDGVYAASARLVLHGQDPYRDFAAAQPPGVYYTGAALLALGDSVLGLRHGLAVVDLALAVLVGAVVLRLTGLRESAVAAGAVALISPWALVEHAQLLPETFAAPLLTLAILAAGSRRWAWLAGAAGACACFYKVAFVLPAGAIAVASAAPGVALGSLGLVLLAEFAGAGLVFGSAFWHGAFQAQTQTGTASLHYAGGLVAQAGWNLLPLLVPAGLALKLRPPGSWTPQLRVVVVAAFASLGLVASLLKHGSYLNVLVAVEPPLLILAACGWTWALRRGRFSGHRLIATALVLSAALGVLETVSLLASPTDPGAFGRPLAASGPGWRLTGSQVEASVARAAQCPAGSAYSGPPYLAFAARRRLPGDQPDQFIIGHARADARFAALAARDSVRCP